MSLVLGSIILAVIVLLNLAYGLILIKVVFRSSTGAPFVPAGRRVIGKMVHTAEICDKDFVFDLGCGDGRVVIAAAKAGAAKAVGIEASLLLVLVARLRVLLSGQGKKCEIRRGNFFLQSDLVDADVVFTFLFPHLMDEIGRQLWPKLRTGSRLVSYSFPLRSATPDTVVPGGSFGSVYLYRKQ